MIFSWARPRSTSASNGEKNVSSSFSVISKLAFQGRDKFTRVITTIFLLFL